MNNMVLQGGILSALMTRWCICIGPDTEQKGCILGQMDWCFVLLSYIELALDRTMVQSFNLVQLESDAEDQSNGCSFASVCLSVCL